jgi:hypothetical protein
MNGETARKGSICMYQGYDPIRLTINRTQYTKLTSTLLQVITTIRRLLLHVESTLPQTLDNERLAFHALVNVFDVI